MTPESKQRQQEPMLGYFLVGAVIGASLALLLAPQAGSESRHELFARIKRMLSVRHNGAHAVNGRTSARRHKRGFNA